MTKVTHPLKPRMRRATVGDLQSALLALLREGLLLANDISARRALADIVSREKDGRTPTYGKGTTEAVRLVQKEADLSPTGSVDKRAAAVINDLVARLDTPTDFGTYRVSGRVISAQSAAVDGLAVVVVDKGVGGDFELGKATTGKRGAFEIVFAGDQITKRGKDAPDLQVQVRLNDDVVAASAVEYDAGPDSELSVVLPAESAAKLLSEHATLTKALSGQFNGALSKLEESDTRQDITYLANKTGWDARAVALASLSQQLSDKTAGRRGQRIDSGLFYALLRAGVPADDTAVFRTPPAKVAQIWKSALDEGLIDAKLADQIDASLARFTEVSARVRLDTPPPGALAGMQPLLALSLTRDDERETFAALHAAHGDDLDTFWTEVEGKLGQDKATRLQTDGKLAYLTLNNSKLVERLHRDTNGDADGTLGGLVKAGFHKADAWAAIMDDTDPVPEAVQGRDAAERRANYAEFMAAQVRLSFPTAVVAEMVRAHETPLVDTGLSNNVHGFLAKHADTFQIGQQPVARFIAKNALDEPPEVVREISRIQRVYQISPDDSSMNAMLAAGLDSAYTVVALPQDDFLRAHKAVLNEAVAMQIYRKAEQVHGAVLNLATAYMTHRMMPAIGPSVGAADGFLNPTPGGSDNFGDVLAYSTLEELFGSMDYCGCEHCRSVLSPAAYLVDLLLFLDRPATEIPNGFTNPLDVLLDRRPDIQHLPLTCENTLTPVPYIDLVSEVLEHFVVNGMSLGGYQGHSTDGQTPPEELLASPQFVRDAAYATLATAQFPAPLPFDRSLEALKALFNRFDAPLHRVMADLRSSDALDDAPYGWRDIWLQRLNISRGLNAVLTESVAVAGSARPDLTVRSLYGFDAGASAAEVRDGLESVRDLCRRTEITPVDLVNILKTEFVNPGAALIPKLEHLGLGFDDIRAFRDGAINSAELQSRMAAGVEPERFGGDVEAWLLDDTTFDRIMGLIVLTNPQDPSDMCDLSALELRHPDPDPLSNRLEWNDFIRINRFIRLWRVLELSIADTDAIISALYPTNQMPDGADAQVDLARMDAGFAELLPQLGIAMSALDALELRPEDALRPILALFGPISTNGTAALFREMFQRPARENPAFAEDGFGGVLTDPAALLLPEVETLRAAFSLTGPEFNRIVAVLGFDDTTPLTIETVSAIYRRGWLARALEQSVPGLERLLQATGLDPYGPQDAPAPALLTVIDLVHRLSELGLSLETALALLLNHDPSGKTTPPAENITTLARDLRAGFTAITNDFVLVDDPDGGIARSHMALVYGAEATEQFFGYLEATSSAEVTYDHSATELEPAILAEAPDQIAYDDFRKVLVFNGLMSTTVRDALQAVAGTPAAFTPAIDALFNASEAQSQPFFTRFPELLPLHDAYRSSTASKAEAYRALLEGILPQLISRRKRQVALQLLGTAIEVEADLAAVLFEKAEVLHAATDPASSALEDALMLESGGLSAEISDGPAHTAPPARVETISGAIDFVSTGTVLPDNQTTPGSSISIRLRGYLEAPENGFFNIAVEADAGATVTLSIAGEPVLLTEAGGIWSNTNAIELRAGTLVEIALGVANVTDRLALRWSAPGRGTEVIGASHLYPADPVSHLGAAYLRTRRIARLSETLKLDVAEVLHLTTHGDLQIAGAAWPNSLPITGTPDDPTSTALMGVLTAHLRMARLKEAYAPENARLVSIAENPAVAIADAEAELFQVTRWDPLDIAALLVHFGLTPADIGDLAVLERLHDIAEWLAALGIPATALIAAATPTPTGPIVRNFRAALRARYSPDDWLKILQPINDRLRKRQRDALVAHILHDLRGRPDAAHINTPEKLFEYFLMDVQMEPCMLTSRVRHALSSVQIFTERCLMNLEPRVAASSLRSKHWEWMKRYRVWEANRKIFLYPENWMEPELRDDQSPFFREAMSELLQGDITEERAATSLIGYLQKLEEVAKLEVCGVYQIEGDPGAADDVLHVIGRTAGAKRSYYHRTRAYGSWSAWEKIPLDIEDNPVMPLVWNNRLFLFWIKMMPENTAQGTPNAGSGPLAEVEASSLMDVDEPTFDVKVMLNWTERVDGVWQPPRSSDPDEPLLLRENVPAREMRKFRKGIRLSSFPWTNGMRISISYKDWLGVSFFMYNTFSTPDTRSPKKAPHFLPKRITSTGSNRLTAIYSNDGITHRLLSNKAPDQATQPHHPTNGEAWESPFFYADPRYVFYVSTKQRIVEVVTWLDFGRVAEVDPTIDTMVLAFEPFAEQPDRIERVTAIPGFGSADLSTLRAFVTEDAFVHTALGTGGTVRFGDRDIGPMGSTVRMRRT